MNLQQINKNSIKITYRKYTEICNLLIKLWLHAYNEQNNKNSVNLGSRSI